MRLLASRIAPTPQHHLQLLELILEENSAACRCLRQLCLPLRRAGRNLCGHYVPLLGLLLRYPRADIGARFAAHPTPGAITGRSNLIAQDFEAAMVLPLPKILEAEPQ